MTNNQICGVYLIENIKTGQRYIGCSKNILRRWREHCNGNSLDISVAIKNYGEENFKLEILEELDPIDDLLDKREIHWIKRYNTYKNPRHYNHTPGGVSHSGKDNPFYGKKHSTKSRKKMSKSHSGKKLTDEHKLNISRVTSGANNPRYRKPVSLSTRKKISDANRGHKFVARDKINMSKSKNTSGYFRVTKRNDSHCKRGFIYVYQYQINGKQNAITSTDLKKLKKKVESKNLIWKKF